jgi:hypothetical protein
MIWRRLGAFCGLALLLLAAQPVRPGRATPSWRTLLVPTLRVGMPSWTLCVLFAQPENPRFESHRIGTTRSVEDGIPTQSVGTS